MTRTLVTTLRHAPKEKAVLAVRTHDMGGTEYDPIMILGIDDAAAITRGDGIFSFLPEDVLDRADPARMHLRRVPPDADDKRPWEFCLKRGDTVTPIRRITNRNMAELRREFPRLSVEPYDDSLEKAVRGRALTMMRARALRAPQLALMHDHLQDQIDRETSDQIREAQTAALQSVLSKANRAVVAGMRTGHRQDTADQAFTQWLTGDTVTFEATRAVFPNEDSLVISYVSGAKAHATQMMDALREAPAITRLAISLGANARMVSGFDNDPYALGFCAGQINHMRVMDMQIYQAALEALKAPADDRDDTPAP